MKPDERAHAVWHDLNYAGLLADYDGMTDRVAAAIREAEAAMRERCAKEAATQRRDVPDSPGGPPQEREEATMQAISAAIRALGD